ncbi:hypothetical protein EBL85_03800 [Marichromatium sp. AB32]|uniref:Outer membrane lipoprotein n=1 Tax=Marichromatium gracile TaxID=1048 RepID=A0A4R4ADP1_MARGR|nr:hypothetical protein [Marichromatium gracile]RNE90606.1 hypothetical protein EBL84_06725 [Marichromatium sp. AB31]RNE93992.1 hypothetical protein EBL85_03800 [Marichromatium sp. AB32]TCW37187.1 outer membrane lipoprotein [Marichromatium gracile]
MRLGRSAGLLLGSLLLQGCAGTPEHCHHPVGDTALAPQTARASDQGTVVSWGGVLLSTRNLATTTELMVEAHPLDDCGRPRTSLPARGHFLIRRPGFLDPAEYRPGQTLTATGRVTLVTDDPPRLDQASLQLWPTADAQRPASRPVTRPWISIGIGSGGFHGVGGGIGIGF